MNNELKAHIVQAAYVPLIVLAIIISVTFFKTYRELIRDGEEWMPHTVLILGIWIAFTFVAFEQSWNLIGRIVPGIYGNFSEAWAVVSFIKVGLVTAGVIHLQVAYYRRMQKTFYFYTFTGVVILWTVAFIVLELT